MTPKRKAKQSANRRKSSDNTIDITEAAGSPGSVDEGAAVLQNRLSELQGEYERAAADWREREDQLIRQIADGENRIRRLRKEAEWDRDRYRSDLINPLLAVLDDFERALAQRPESGEEDAFAEGVSLIAGRFRESLASLGLQPIEALGEKFDPNLHEALMQVPDSDEEKGFIVQEIQKGYKLGNRVLRPSKVAVAG